MKSLTIPTFNHSLLIPEF